MNVLSTLPTAGRRADDSVGGAAFRLNGFPWRQTVTALFLFALLLRLMIAGAYLNAYDTEWNMMWGVELADHTNRNPLGFFGAFAYVTNLDYPPLYLYPLYVVGLVLRHPAISGYPPLRMLAIKFLPCLADSLTCVVLYHLGARRDQRMGLLAAVLWAVNPATIFNCACWGQTDCVLLCMAALLFAAMTEKRLAAAGVLFAAMCSTKLQGLYLTPVVGMELLTVCFGSLHVRTFRREQIDREGIRHFLRFAGAAAGTFAVIYLPFMIGSALMEQPDKAGFWEKFLLPVTVYGGGLDKYPYTTMNADNLYMLCGLNGVKDSEAWIPGVRLSTVGNLFLLASMAGVVAFYLLGKRRSHWMAACWFMNSVFMLTCRQHERYQILTLIMLLGAFVVLEDRRLFTLFTGQTLVIFVNQFRILSAVREKSGWWHYYNSISAAGMNDRLQTEKIQVMRDGAAWLAHNTTVGKWNAFINVCLLVASSVLVFRFYFDSHAEIPLRRRVREWYETTAQRR